MVFVIIFGGWQFSQGKLQAGFICVGSFLLMAGMSYFFSIVAAS
jgi:hypothetical protein